MYHESDPTPNTLPPELELLMKDFGNSDLILPRIHPCHPELEHLIVEDLETLHLSLVRIPPPIPHPGVELLMEDLRNLDLCLCQNTPTPLELGLLMEDFRSELTQNTPSRLPPRNETSYGGLRDFRSERSQNIPPTGTSHGGFCVMDWCVETINCIPNEYRLISVDDQFGSKTDENVNN